MPSQSSVSLEIEKMKAANMGLSTAKKAAKGKLLFSSIKQGLIASGLSAKEANRFLIDLVSVGVSADRFTANEEYDLFQGIFGKSYSYMDFFNLTNGGAAESFLEKVDYVVDHASYEIKKKCCEFVFLFLSSDYSLRSNEEKVIRLLLEGE